VQKVGIVIPTIFSRTEYLPLAAKSIKDSGNSYLLLSSPKPTASQQLIVDDLLAKGLIDEHFIETTGLPLAEKINEALRALPMDCELIGWLGDDDLLTKDAIKIASEKLTASKDAVMVYGGVDYIDKDGRVLFTNPSSQFHEKLLRFGPQLIPQPGALWRRSALEEVGGLTGEFNLAFDFDLFLKLKSVGRLLHIPQTLAQFRWHPDSLSVKRRWVSVSEASKVRRKHYLGLMKLIWPIWEPWVMLATWFAGKLVTLRARSLTQRP
jgi:hypothetical protein